MDKIKRILTAAGILLTNYGFAQTAFDAMPHLFTIPKHYAVTYTSKAPKIDGNITDPVWKQAAWTDEFVDIEGDLKPRPALGTRLKMLWTDSCLFIAVKMQEPHLWANLTHHDDIIYSDNDFEIFIDPNNDSRNYFEIEINQRNKIFDLFMDKPYRDKGDALISWDTPGIETAVQLQGSLNNSSDTDSGWTAELKIPFKAVHIGFASGVPVEGSLWRINFSRVEWDTLREKNRYAKLKDSQGKNLPERNWVWSPQGIVSMHMPERWGYLQFTKKEQNGLPVFKVPYSDKQKQYLWLVYYSQQKYFAKYKHYAARLSDLNIDTTEFEIDGIHNTLTIDSSASLYLAQVADIKGLIWTINNDGMLRAK